LIGKDGAAERSDFRGTGRANNLNRLSPTRLIPQESASPTLGVRRDGVRRLTLGLMEPLGLS